MNYVVAKVPKIMLDFKVTAVSLYTANCSQFIVFVADVHHRHELSAGRPSIRPNWASELYDLHLESVLESLQPVSLR